MISRKIAIGVIILVCLAAGLYFWITKNTDRQNNKQIDATIAVVAPVTPSNDTSVFKKICENKNGLQEAVILYACGKYYQKEPSDNTLDAPSILYDEEGVDVGSCGGNRSPEMPNAKGCEIPCDMTNLCTD